MSLNNLVSIVFLMLVMELSAFAADVLELDTSQVQGKKDQPEAMTFVSRAALDFSEPLSSWKPMARIKQELSRDIFSVSITK